MKYQIAYTNRYGNAGVLAKEIMKILPSKSTDVMDLSYCEISSDADVYLIGFEIVLDTLPLNIINILEKLEGKTVLCFATCGVATTENQERIKRTILPFLPDECDYRGLFVCPGQIPANVMDTTQKVLDKDPENKLAKTMMEGFQRSMNHPDMEDLYNLRRFINASGI